MVAIDDENQKLLVNYLKQQKSKNQSKDLKQKIIGFKMIRDEEFETLKIDFGESFSFWATDLEKTKLM